MALGENIRAARERKGWTTLELALEVGSRLGRPFAQSNISRYELNEIKPRPKVMEAIANAVEVPQIVLEYGDRHLLTASIGTHKVPLIQWGSAAEYISASPRGHDTMGAYLLAKKQYSSKVFGMTVADDSMAPKFHAGYDIFVDPDVKPGPNDAVVALYDGREWLRQYKERASGFELVPLNDGYASIRSEDGATILGTVVEWHIYR